jgi:hypothetical protein
MTPNQKKQQEDYFKMVLKHSNPNGIYFWIDEKATYTIVDGKFSPNNSRSRKAMMTTTGKTFHDDFMVK